MRIVVKKGSLQLPRNGALRSRRIGVGDVVPAGALAQAELDRLIHDGVLGAEPEATPKPRRGLPPTRGKWQHDPAALAGKSADQLRAMVLDCDPGIDVDDLSEASMVQLLTSDYHPAFAGETAISRDRHRPDADTLRAARRGAARP